MLPDLILKALRSVSDSPELLKPDEVTDSQLHIDVGNLKEENERLQTDYAQLLESSTVVTNKLREEVQQLRSQLEAERTRWDELQEEVSDREETCAELQSENSDLKKTCAQLRKELSDLKQKSATASELPEAADVLNKLKAQRKKSRADLADMEVVLDILENH